MPKINLLFLNVGRRVELIQAFRDAFKEMGIKGRIVTTDINGLAPALYLGDSNYITSRSVEPDFLNQLSRICQNEKINIIIPTIDPDLPVLARNKKEIEATNTNVLISDQRIIDICTDKLKTGNFLTSNGFPAIRALSFKEARGQDFPLFLKPKSGSSSINTQKINSIEELEFFAKYIPDPLIQKYIEGDEITIDVFSDWSGKPIIAVPRKRLKVRGGEVSVAMVESDEKLEKLCRSLAVCLGTVGPINVQVIRSGNSYHILEINPRFGGGCPLAIAAGVPLAKWVIMMALSRPITIDSNPLKDGLTMMRCDHSFFYKRDQLVI